MLDLPSQQEDVEISRDDALKSLLKNEDFNDIRLRGSDDIMVFANRYLLASRSPVFSRMLLGQFKEASKTVIDVGYDGAVLQAIIDYIYTDQVAVLESKNDETNVWNIDFSQFLITLMNAAIYFSLPLLRQKIETLALEKMKDNHNAAILFLAVCLPDYDTTKVLEDRALSYVKENPEVLVNGSNNVVALIDPSYIETIIKDDDVMLEEHCRFQMLQSWATAPEERDVANNQNYEEQTCWPKSHQQVAAQMTNYIHLENIDPQYLSTTVSSSGLVTLEQLSEAYKTQALRAHLHRGPVYKKWRWEPVWKSSRTTSFEYDDTIVYDEMPQADTLDRPILKFGIHKWSIKVLEFAEGVELGVVSMRWPFNSSNFLGFQRGGWGFGEGLAMHAHGQENQTILLDAPKFSDGSTVSLTLDLEREGVLSASIDGNTPFVLFSGMCQELGNDIGFIPAVSVRRSIEDSSRCRIEFLGFESLS